MHYAVLMGSPRKEGNTMSLLRPCLEELGRLGATHALTWLYDLEIRGCTACRACQKDWSVFGCRFHDDAQGVFDAILAADVVLLATPIYSWYCTAPMKALLDRLVYGMNKYYGETKGPALWVGKRLAVVATCGYEPEKGADLFEQGMRRYCKHSKLEYRGMLVERDMGYKSVFMDEEKALRAAAFARQLANAAQTK